MTLKRWDGAAYQDIAAIKRWDGSAWVDLTILRRWDGSAWVDIPLPGGGGGSLSVTVNSSSNGRFLIVAEPAPSFKYVQTLNPSVVTPTGGTAPYTYAWTRISGDSAVLCNSPTAASTHFNANVGKHDTVSATWRCTVTDAAAAVRTVDVLVTLSYETNL